MSTILPKSRTPKHALQVPPEFIVCLHLSDWSGKFLENGPDRPRNAKLDGLEDLEVPGCSEEADNPLRFILCHPHLCLTQACNRCLFYSPGGVALLHQLKLATFALPRSFPSRWRASATNAGKDFADKAVKETRSQQTQGQQMRLCIWRPTQNEEFDIIFSQDTMF